MARGWESKSVEAQQDEAIRRTSVRPALSDAQRAERARRQTLELSRSRALDDLTRATAPHHRQMLEATIRALDEQIASVDD